MNNPLAAICIGHSRAVNGRHEGGAVAADGATNEWTYNSALAPLIVSALARQRIAAVIVDAYEGHGYGAAQRWLATHLKELGVILAVELHFNDSDDAGASGHEWLYWHSSAKGKRLAESLSDEFCLGMPEIRMRGAKALGPNDRGAEFLKGTHCPAVICEPFFGSNRSNWSAAVLGRQKIANAIAEGIAEYLD